MYIAAMKTIEHERKHPDYHSQWANEKYGEPAPSDLVWFLLPILSVSVCLFLAFN